MSRPLRWFLIAAVLVAGMALAVPFLVPVSSLIPEIAARAAASLGQPVKIADLTAQLLPTPRVVATGVRVGGKDEIVVGELEIVPDLLSFLGGVGSVRLLRAERVELKEAALAIAERMPSGGAPVDVKRVALLDVRLQHRTLRLPPFDLDARLAPGLEVETLRFSTRDGSFKLLLDEEAGGGHSRIRTPAG